MEIQKEMMGDIAVVSRGADYWALEEEDKLRETFDALIAQGNRKLVVDLKRVSSMYSSALGLLVRVNSNYAKLEGRVVLCNVDPKIQNVFVIAKVDQSFEIQPDLQRALAQFS